MLEASEEGEVFKVEALLQGGLDVDSTSIYGSTALMKAAFNNQLNTVEALISAGANMDLQDRDGRTALMWAAGYGHMEVVQALLDAGADFGVGVGGVGAGSVVLVRWLGAGTGQYGWRSFARAIRKRTRQHTVSQARCYSTSVLSGAQ